MILDIMLNFYHLANFKSYTKASQKLNISKATLSRQMMQLENELGLNLINRNTRNFALTESGNRLYKHCTQLYGVFHSIQNEFAVKSSIRQIKISVPPAYALHLFKDPLLMFNKMYPNVKLDIRLDVEIIDMISNSYDLAIRSAKLNDSNLIVKKIANIRQLICISSKYLPTNKKLDTLKDLEHHEIASYYKLGSKINFKKDSISYEVIVNNKLISNSLDFILQLVLQGEFIGIFPEFMVKTRIKSGELINLFSDYSLGDSPLYAMHPSKHISPEVRALIELIKSQLEQV